MAAVGQPRGAGACYDGAHSRINVAGLQLPGRAHYDSQQRALVATLGFASRRLVAMEETAWATEDDAWLGQLGELASGAVLASEMAAGEFFDASEETHVCIESFLSHEDGETMPRTRDLPHIVTSLRADIKHVSRNAKRQRKASRPLMPTTCKLRTAMQFVKHLDDPLKQLGGTMGQALTLFDLVDGFEEAVDRAQANGGDDWTHATDDALTRMAAFDNVAEEHAIDQPVLSLRKELHFHNDIQGTPTFSDSWMERVLTPLDIDTMDQLVASHAVEQDGHSKAPSESDDVNTISAITQWIFDGDGHQWIPVESVTVDHIEEVTVMTRDEHGYSGDEYQLPVFEAPVLRTRDPSSTWKESKQLHALAPRISHIDEADEHEKLAVDLFPLTDAGAFDWRTFFFNDTVDNAAMDGAMEVPSPSSKIETSDIDCGTGSMRSTMTTLGMKMLPMHELIMQLSWNPIAKAFHGKSPLHLALNMIVDNERDREPVPVSFMNVLQEIAIETTEVDCSDENLPLKPLRPGNKLITSLKTLKNSAPPKRAKKQFRGLDEIHKFMELRGKKHKHAAKNVHTTVVGRDVTNKAIRLPSRNFTMEEALASVELLPAVDKETVTQLPSSVHVLQNRPLIGSLLNRYRIDLMGVDACATLPNSSERSAQIQADIIVDEYTAIVLQPLNSLLRKVVDDRVTFVDAVAVGLAARFQTVVIVFEAYDPRSDVSLPIYPFTPPIQERLFQELSAATALSSPLKVQIQYSASAIHSASLIRAVVERCHHSNTRNIADNTKTAWLEEPVSDTVAFLCSLGMFHPLSAQRLLSRVDSLTALLAMEWDEMYVAAHDCMPEHSLRAFYQWTTAAPRE